MANLTFRLNEKLYLKDPQHTELGRKIIRSSIELIDLLGFEDFTFKKLAEEISSTEASVYRYFENKHRLLHYLVAWYWSWLDYRIDLAASGLGLPADRLTAALRVIAENKKYDPTFEFVNEEALHRIVINELDKTFLTKWVDDDNQAGLFGGFKNLCRKISEYITNINPAYAYPSSLASTVLLAANQQLFFAQHLRSLSDLPFTGSDEDQHEQLFHFLSSTVFNALQS